jgi:hypothetical protein
MLNSYELVEVALWMMLIGGGAAGLGLLNMLLSDSRDSRGSLSKPITFIGLGFLMVGIFLDHYYY